MENMIYVLVAGEYDDRGVIGAFETPELAAEWLGSQILAGAAPHGPVEMEECEYTALPDPPVDQPDVDPVGAAATPEPAQDIVVKQAALRDALSVRGPVEQTLLGHELLELVRSHVRELALFRKARESCSC
jgi:hypothetical protein